MQSKGKKNEKGDTVDMEKKKEIPTTIKLGPDRQQTTLNLVVIELQFRLFLASLCIPFVALFHLDFCRSKAPISHRRKRRFFRI